MLPGIFLAESEQFLVVEAPFLCPLLFLNYIINMKKKSIENAHSFPASWDVRAAKSAPKKLIIPRLLLRFQPSKCTMRKAISV